MPLWAQEVYVGASSARLAGSVPPHIPRLCLLGAILSSPASAPPPVAAPQTPPSCARSIPIGWYTCPRMLCVLNVENLLLMELAQLRRAPGLNVLTGETGAGKTVLAHALDLLLGGRGAAPGRRGRP